MSHDHSGQSAGGAPGWVVTRYGRPVSPALPDENAGFAWILDHQGMSVDWAMRYDGYGITEAPADTSTVTEA